MQNKKIIFLIPTLEKGGGERVVSELSLNLPSNVEKLIVLFENKISYPYKGKIISLNIPFSKNFFLKVYYLFSGLFRFKRIIKKEKPSYTISLGNAPNIFNALVGKRAIIRGDNFLSEGYNTFWGRVYKVLVRLLFNKSGKIITVSKGIKNDFVKNFGIQKEKIQVIYNPIDVRKIQILAKEPLEPTYQEIFRNPTIINIGRLGEQKGQWHLIRAFGGVKKRRENLKLVILGEGKLKPYLKNLIKDLDLEESVYLLGLQENPFKFLARSKLFVLSSFWEGLPTVILEAMACGLPIISADCKSGPREILAPDSDLENQTKEIEQTECGVLVPVCDNKFYKATKLLTTNEKMLRQAIIEILDNKNLLNKLRLKSKRRVKDFNTGKIIKQWDFINN